MMLGNLIARFKDEATAAEALLMLDDLVLVTRIREAAARNALTPEAFVVEAVGGFVGGASDEDWASVIGHINRNDDPGLTFLKRMIDIALTDAGTAASALSDRGH